MNRFQFLLILSVTLAMVTVSLPSTAHWGIDHLRINHLDATSVLSRGWVCLTGVCSGEEDEIGFGSVEMDPRMLAQKARYISYRALKKNSVSCNRRGQSYYNCNKMGKVNPYRRGCSVITHCARSTD